MSGGSARFWFMLGLSRRLAVCFFRRCRSVGNNQFLSNCGSCSAGGCANQNLAPIYSGAFLLRPAPLSIAEVFE